jgi:hypothetical protein
MIMKVKRKNMRKRHRVAEAKTTIFPSLDFGCDMRVY